jgi:hypothetical protein
MVSVATVFIGDGDSEGWGQYPLSGELKKLYFFQPNFGLATFNPLYKSHTFY